MGTSEVISTSRGSPPLAVMLCTALLCACATVPRKPAPPVLFANVAPSGIPHTVLALGLVRQISAAPGRPARSRPDTADVPMAGQRAADPCAVSTHVLSGR